MSLIENEPNVRFQYKADTRVESSERLLSSESGHSNIPYNVVVQRYNSL